MSIRRLREQPRSFLYSVKAFYLGAESMGELAEGENGSDAVQKPLKRTIMKSQDTREEVNLSITTDTMMVTPIHSKSSLGTGQLVLPIELLAYCGALRQQPSERYNDQSREFETLDKAVYSNSSDPPLFVTIFRSLEQVGMLNCHSFVISKDDEAMELVKLIMEIYYNLARLQEAEENNQKKMESLNLTDTKSESNYNDLLEFYNSTQSQQVQVNNKSDINVLLDEEFRKKYDLDNYEIVNRDQLKNDQYSHVALSNDDDPIIIKKPNDEKLVYQQNVFIRWLQPPTPPPPAPIISKILLFFFCFTLQPER